MAAPSSGRWIFWLIVILLLGVGGWFGWKYWEKNANKPPEYRTAQVTTGDIIQMVTASGQLNPVLSVQVGSQISGIIQNLYADFNTIVTQGMVVAKLEPSTYQSAVLQAEGELANAKAVLELSQVEEKRAEELKAGKLIAASEYDKAVADLHQAQAQVTIRQAGLQKATVDLSRCTIYAPTNGIVISRNVDVGQTVAASFSAPTLFVMANDLSKMQIDCMVSEADIGGIETNQDVQFTVDAFPSRNFHGTVIQIRNAPTTNQNVVTYDTVVEVNNRDLKLKPGMTANVSIIIAQRENVIKVPNAAFRFKPVDPNEKKTPAASGLRAGAESGGGYGGPGSGREGAGSGRRQGQGPGSGGPGGPGSPGRPPGARPRSERSPLRTVYVLPAQANAETQAKPEARQVKVGIGDAAFSEVLDGLKEGETVVVGQNLPASAAPTTAPANPFGGGGMRRF
jgi:HlyD family secretion protein